jgi:hypothetical protein
LKNKKNKILLKLQKNHEKERNLDKKNKKDRSEEWNEYLDRVSYILSQKFSYSRLVAACDAKGGFEVHGFLQSNYYGDYEKLFNDNVLDRACLYSKEDYKPEIIHFLDIKLLKSWSRSIIELDEPCTLKNYPNLPYSKCVLYSEKPFEGAIREIDGYPYNIGGYDTSVVLKPANIGLIGWALWDLPVFALLHAPGKNRVLYKIVGEAKDIDREMKDILKKIIHSSRAYINTSNDKIDELNEFLARRRKMYDDLKNQMLANAPMMEEADFVKFEKGYMKRQNSLRRRVRWGKVGFYGVIFVIVALIVLAAVRFMNTPIAAVLPGE